MVRTASRAEGRGLSVNGGLQDDTIVGTPDGMKARGVEVNEAKGAEK